MPTDINVSQLIINKLTQAQYNEAQAAGNISESELYFVTDDAATPVEDVVAAHNESADAHADIRASIPSIAGLATETYVDEAVAAIPDAYTKSETYTKTEVDTAISTAIETAFAGIARAEGVEF